MKKKLDAKTRAKAIKGLKKTLKKGNYYWRERAYGTLKSLEYGLPLHISEWKFWASAGSGKKS